MNKITEIIFGDSTYFSMSNSKLNNNLIIKFNTFFSIGDLTDIENFNIYVSNEIFNETKYNFNKEIKLLNESIKNNNKLRIWCSLKDSDEYILLIYLCNYLKNTKCNLYVVNVDNYFNNIQSVSMLREKELEKVSKYEKKLNTEDIKELSYEWENIINKKADIRLMIDKKIKLVSYDYFDDIIINKLKELGKVKESRLVANLLSEYNLVDLIFVYLINRLINKNIIKVIEKNERAFDNIIEI